MHPALSVDNHHILLGIICKFAMLAEKFLILKSNVEQVIS